TATIQITGVTAVAAQPLTVSLSGAGASTYALTQPTFSFAVVAQRSVQLSSATDYMVVGAQGSAAFALASLPTLADDSIVLTLLDGNGIVWSTATVTLSASSSSAGVSFTASATGTVALDSLVSVASTSTEYSTSLSNSLSVTVLTTSSTSITLPPFAYVGTAHNVDVVLSASPPPGRSVVVQCSSPSATLSAVTFTSSSNLNATALATPTTATSSGLISCTLSGSGAAFFTAPQPESYIIRSLEVISVSASATQLYVNQNVVVTVSLARDPQHAGTELQVAATSNVASNISPANLIFQAGSGVITAQFTLSFATVGQATISVTATGSASNIYAPTTQTVAITVNPQEVVSLSVDPTAVDATSGFVYVQNSVALTVSLGTPAIAHQQTVSVQ
ncbi:Hypothetical protein, putative, partial [Bodo saltans]